MPNPPRTRPAACKTAVWLVLHLNVVSISSGFQRTAQDLPHAPTSPAGERELATA